MTPRVSVLIPIYNAERYLERAIRSILEQTYEDFEIVAVDDGSKDNSLQLLERLRDVDERLRILSRPNTGIVGALNDGLAVARGELIARMDADDIALPDRLAKQVAFLEANPRCVAVGSAFIFIDADDALLQWNPRPVDHASIERDLLSGDGGALIHPVVTFRRRAIDQAGGYRKETEWVEDLDLFLRLAQVGELANLPDVLLYYRYHTQSVNFTRNAGRMERQKLALAQAHAARGLPFDAARWSRPQHPQGLEAGAARGFALASLHFQDRCTPWRYAWRALRRGFFHRDNWRVIAYLAKVEAGLIQRPNDLRAFRPLAFRPDPK